MSQADMTKSRKVGILLILSSVAALFFLFVLVQSIGEGGCTVSACYTGVWYLIFAIAPLFIAGLIYLVIVQVQSRGYDKPAPIDPKRIGELIDQQVAAIDIEVKQHQPLDLAQTYEAQPRVKKLKLASGKLFFRGTMLLLFGFFSWASLASKPFIGDLVTKTNDQLLSFFFALCALAGVLLIGLAVLRKTAEKKK